MRPLLALLLPLLLSTSALAQLGLHPPKADWQRLSTPEANILYTPSYAARAQRIANLLHAMRLRHDQTVGDRHYNFDLVLQTPNLNINGYVGLAPFRSEFFLTSPQQPNLLSNSDWADLLAIHEFRHVQQLSNERRGITRLASYLFGQLGWAGFAGLATPNWYREGDAVVMETALTNAGRGATPAFSSTLRALLDEGINYSYARARNNSLKRNIPDHYRYGYNTITYARGRFGEQVWEDVLHDGASYKGLFYPFSRNLKKATGLGTRKMYRAALDGLAERQDSQLQARAPFVAGEPIGPDYRAVTNYRFPQADGQGRLYALRAGYQHTPDLVRIDPETGREEKVVPVGIQREPYVDVHGKYAVWMENRNHPRYTNQGFSDVFLYDLQREQKFRLSKNQKYFSPSLSWDNQLIAVVEEDVFAGELHLVILNTSDGSVSQRTALPGANSIALPKFLPDNQSVVFYEKTFDGTAIKQVDLTTQEITTVLPYTWEPLGNLQTTANGFVIYGSGRDGIDNAYQLDPATGRRVQLTNVRIGAEDPYLPPDGTLVYTEATPKGMRLRQLRLAATSEKALQPGLPGGLLPEANNAFQRAPTYSLDAYPLTDNVPDSTYASEDVSDTWYGPRLHSWSVVGDAVAPGIGVAMSNALQTFTVDLTGRYNINEERPVIGFGVAYGGLPVVLRAGVNFFDRRYFNTMLTDTSLQFNVQEFNQTAISLTASLPLSWVAGEFSYGLAPSLGVTRFRLGADREGSVPGNFTGGQVGFVAQVLQRRARQQVQSRLGAALRVNYQNTVSEAELGESFHLESRVWLPGIWRTHSFRLEADYQRENTRNAYQYVDRFQYARGYDVSFADNVYCLRMDYELPVLHPDIGILGIWYLQRVRLNGFYDYGQYEIPGFGRQTMSSVGAEVFLDQVIFNNLGISGGLRVSYLLEDARFGNTAGVADFSFVLSQRF